MLTVFSILVLLAIIATFLHAYTPGRCPLWVAVGLLILIELLRIVPLGR